VKEGVATDATNRDKLTGLLRFHTSKSGDKQISLQEYVDHMVEGQDEIYYLFGEDIKSIARSPHLDVFKSRGVEVLFLTETIDSFMMNSIMEFKGKKFHNGADADLELPNKPETEPEGEALPEGELKTLVERFKEILGERVSEVRESKVLTESPVRLVSPDKGFGADMERVYRLLDKEFSIPSRILELNPRNPLIRNLSTLGDSPLVDQVAEQLFENALLLEGIHPNPADMVSRIQALMEAATRRS
jgi:molecular chaperone HtpG